MQLEEPVSASDELRSNATLKSEIETDQFDQFADLFKYFLISNAQPLLLSSGISVDVKHSC